MTPPCSTANGVTPCGEESTHLMAEKETFVPKMKQCSVIPSLGVLVGVPQKTPRYEKADEMQRARRMVFGRYDYASFLTFIAYAAGSVVVPVCLVALARELGFRLDRGGLAAGGAPSGTDARDGRLPVAVWLLGGALGQAADAGAGGAWDGAGHEPVRARPRLRLRVARPGAGGTGRRRHRRALHSLCAGPPRRGARALRQLLPCLLVHWRPRRSPARRSAALAGRLLAADYPGRRCSGACARAAAAWT